MFKKAHVAFVIVRLEFSRRNSSLFLLKCLLFQTGNPVSLLALLIAPVSAFAAITSING